MKVGTFETYKTYTTVVMAHYVQAGKHLIKKLKKARCGSLLTSSYCLIHHNSYISTIKHFPLSNTRKQHNPPCFTSISLDCICAFSIVFNLTFLVSFLTNFLFLSDCQSVTNYKENTRKQTDRSFSRPFLGRQRS